MRAFLISLLKYMLLGAVIGAVAGLVTAEFMPEGAVGGAAIGAIIGAFFGTRIRAAQGDSSFAGGVHTGIDATERRE